MVHGSPLPGRGKNGNISDFGQPAQPGRPGRGPARKSFQVQEEDLVLSEHLPATQWRFFSGSMQTFRFPKTFPRISLISLPEATTLHPATENPTGSAWQHHGQPELSRNNLTTHRLAAPLPSRYVSQSHRCCRAADGSRDYRFRQDCRATDAVVGQRWAVLDGGPGDGGPVVWGVGVDLVLAQELDPDLRGLDLFLG